MGPAATEVLTQIAAEALQGAHLANAPIALGPQRFNTLLDGGEEGGIVVEQVYVVAHPHIGSGAARCMVFGLSSLLPWTDSYRLFLDQVAAHVYTAQERIEETAHRAAMDAERRNLLEQAPVATALLVGPHHVFELANPRFCELVGRTRRDLLGRPCEDALPELRGAAPISVMSEVFSSGQAISLSEVLAPIDRGKGPEDCFFNFNFEPVRNSSGETFGLMAVAVEITELVRGRQALETTYKERERLLTDLEAAGRAKDEFLAMLGHELRNPLSPIVTALSLLEEREDASLRDPLSVISRQTEHLIRLVDDLLDVAKITQGKVALHTENLDMADILSVAVDNASSLLESRSHHLELDCPRATFHCHGDRVRLAQVFANLIINAARYTEPQGHIHVSVQQRGKTLTVKVRDDGKGISKSMLPKVFNIFEQGQRTTDRSEGGLGLGLALVKSLTAMHGGAVKAQSAGTGRGSTFSVTLPAVTPRPGEEVTVSFRQTPAQPISTTGRRILLVDDNVDAGSLLAMVLQKAGHVTQLVSEPLSGLAVAADFKPEIAVLDIGLPVIDGYELADRLLKVPGCEACMLIALTGYGQARDRERSAAAGFAHHLVKPVKTSTLLSLVQGVPVEARDRT